MSTGKYLENSGILIKDFENEVKEQKDCFPDFIFGILGENLLEILLTPKKADDVFIWQDKIFICALSLNYFWAKRLLLNWISIQWSF